MKQFEILHELPNVAERHEVNKCCWKNGAKRLARCRVTTNLQLVRNTISANRNKAEHNKMRSACIMIFFP